MSKEKKKIMLSKAMTWSGINYAPGLNHMPVAAADSAVRRGFGALLESAAGGKDDEGVAASETGFTPLSFEETVKRFDENDFSDEVMRSMQTHKETFAEFKASGLSTEEFVKSLTKGETGLPEDFPMRHVFEKLGEDFDSVEKIQKISLEDLIAVDGIGEASAKKALAYGK